uniref:Uncharacterized protein n=1 Tax=Candidatus Kentrum sp. LPFa TaxID=2126335 RepID=A0A450W0U9_9GAMM|nr:MAG: hypothetical protein BECKLPF1236A_GA0070988_100413 [Candidatus Kentron sp. LPFa]VFK26704.1 MAG: hypothetical protein BECKLPF1236C_GA0070990_100385 [Candidatus Kentron sp. LPFa]
MNAREFLKPKLMAIRVWAEKPQGINVHLITKKPEPAAAFGRLAIEPMRLAFDFLSPAIKRETKEDMPKPSYRDLLLSR